MFSKTPGAGTETGEAEAAAIELEDEQLESVQGGHAGQASGFRWLDDACERS